MTIEEAIKHCEEVATGKTEQGKCSECAADHKHLAEWLRELVALRAQHTPLDRSQWEGCDECRIISISRKMVGLGRRYCHYCGRPLTEEAWAELERRINSGTTDNET